MRFTFPPYGKKIDGKFKNNYKTKIPCCCSLLFLETYQEQEKVELFMS